MAEQSDTGSKTASPTINYPAQVYFIRHGIAAERGTSADDDQRPLVNKGIRKTEKIAQRLVELGLQFDGLLTSPLVRAVQTAEILCRAGAATDYQIFQPLAPEGRLCAWLAWLADWLSPECQSIALVGHEPELSQWAQLLVQGTADDRWVLKKAGIIGIDIPAYTAPIGASQLVWLAPPRFIV